MADTGTQVTMTVTNDTPLLVIADGASISTPAAGPVDVTFSIGDRVRATLRDPQIPVVTGTITEETV